MTGITDNIEKILPVLSEAECLKGWTLVGGTALAIQIGHRESEDLDFMKWNFKGDCSVDWPVIRKELTAIFGSEPEMDLLGHDQVQFFVNGVKLSFFIADCRNPLKDTVPFTGNIILADIDSIAIMKMELALTRGKYRDYYDLYCIFKDRQDIVPMAAETSRYTGHTIKSKFILSILTNKERFASDMKFQQLNPKYDVDAVRIEQFFRTEIASELESSMKKK